MFAVIGRGLFYEVAPTRFGTLGKAFFTLFQLITLDDWFYMYSDVVAKSPGFYCHPRRRLQWFVTWRAKRTSAYEPKVFIPFIFTAKFVVSRCAFCKLRRDFEFFCSVNQLSGCGAGCKSQRNFAAKPKLRMTLDCSKIAKEIEVVGGMLIWRGKKADFASFLQVR